MPAEGHRRKLIPEILLAELAQKASLGVPINTLLRQHELSCTRPTLKTLIHAYNDISDDSHYTTTVQQTISASLFPAWLDPQYKDAQEAPPAAKYDGRFPLGQWSDAL